MSSGRTVVKSLAAALLCGLAIFVQGRAVADEARPPARLAEETVRALDAVFAGPHAGYRAVHADGIVCEGSFTAAPAAAALSRAPHFLASTTVPVIVRLSNFTGLPGTPDGDDQGGPRGFAVKFILPGGGDTDIVAHSYDGFPVATGEGFVEFLESLASPDRARLAGFAQSHPSAKAFLDAPKPAPVSYATERFFGVNAFRFTNAGGESRFGRYLIVPEAGDAHLSAADAARQPADYLAADLARRLSLAPVRFRIFVQLAAAADPVADATQAWPQERPRVEIGTLSLTGLVAPQARGQLLLFTPLNLVAGIAPSADPLLVARNRAYRVSYGRRARTADALAENPAAAPAEPAP